MAVFKVGDRVRITVPGSGVRLVFGYTPPPGQTGTVVAPPDLGGYYLVDVDGVPAMRAEPKTLSGWLCMGAWLAPLTDPRADAFLESIKKLAREPNNIVEKSEC